MSHLGLFALRFGQVGTGGEGYPLLASVLHAASYLALFFGDFVRLACFAQLLIQSAAARRLLKPKLTASSE